MTADKIFNTVTRDIKLINFAGKTAKTVRFLGAAVGLAVAAVTVIDAVKLIRK